MIRKIKKEDRETYLNMVKDFYSSKAVDHKIPKQNIANTFEELMRLDTYAQGYILEHQNHAVGYALLSKTFSQEAGGMVLWVEEIYVMPKYQNCGLGQEFFSFLKNELCKGVKRIRLEAEGRNQRAISLYKRLGFKDLPYSQMVIDF